MANAILLTLIPCILCVAIFFIYIANTQRKLLYSSCRRALRTISNKLVENKALLFRHKDKKSIKALGDLLELITKTSLLLKKSSRNNPKQKVSALQLCAYIDDCRQRSLFYFKSLAYHTTKENKNANLSYRREKNSLRGSCYFCSQPILFPFFRKATIHSQGNKLCVPSCHTCKKALGNSYKVNILCFFEDEEKVHWSQCKTYEPRAKYWDINEEALKASLVKKKTPSLKIVRNKETDHL